jgi:hypothetical protein
MTQPEHVPVAPADRVRQLEKLPPPRRWVPARAGETVKGMPTGGGFGVPGPDQGFALRLARSIEPRLSLASGEHKADVLAGGVALAMRRAAIFHRAPVIHDLEVAFTVWGFLGDAPDDLVAHRRTLFEGAAHGYDAQRAIACAVTEESLRLDPATLRGRLVDSWRTFMVT